MTVTALGSAGSSGDFAANIWTPQRTPAMAPVQGMNFSNVESGMTGSLPCVVPVTLTGVPNLLHRSTRPHDPIVPKCSGTVPGRADTAVAAPPDDALGRGDGRSMVAGLNTTIGSSVVVDGRDH